MRNLIIGILALSLAGPAFADPGDNRGRGRDNPPGHSRHHHDKWDRGDDRRHGRDHHRQERRHHEGERGYRLTRDQLRYLPALPHGQEYRRMGNDLVRVDSDTLKIVAVLGLLSAFLATR